VLWIGDRAAAVGHKLPRFSDSPLRQREADDTAKSAAVVLALNVFLSDRHWGSGRLPLLAGFLSLIGGQCSKFPRELVR